ncbi:MAG: hypothetical protein U0625_13780 [Phycisphaerales bacterium]
MNLTLLDWIIVGVFLASMMAVARSTRRYSTSVAGFLAANRCAGRYLISVADSRAAIGLISLAWFFQQYYDSGFTNIWWGFIEGPVMIMLALTGWVAYRFRETRALTLAQFLEARYSRSFRVFCGLLAFVAGILNYGIFPAVSARFLIAFCGLPDHFMLAGMQMDTYIVTVGVLLSTALFFVFAGGQIAVMVTDFLQGIFGNLVFFLVCGYMLWSIPWEHVAQTMLAQPKGHSMVNPSPLSLSGETNFNATYWLIQAFILLYTTKAWQGDQGYNAAALDANEARMANVLNGWRFRVLVLLVILAPVMIKTWMSHPAYESARAPVAAQLAPYEQELASARAEIAVLEAQGAEADAAAPAPPPAPEREHALQLARERAVRAEASLSELRTPHALAGMLPPILMGLLAAAFLGCYLGTDDTYLHSWGTIFVQDVVMPLRARFNAAPLDPARHIRWLKGAIFVVAVWGFCFSILFRTPSQRIAMYCGITATMFVAGAGAAIIGGLYTRWGTRLAAWSAMLTGMVLSLGVIVLKEFAWIPRSLFGTALEPVARAVFWFDQWNGQVLSFWTMLAASVVYVVVSVAQWRGPASAFDLDRLLHRGKWRVEGSALADAPATRWYEKIGFDRELTGADKWVMLVTISWPLFWTIVFLGFMPWVLAGTVSDQGWLDFWHAYTLLIFVAGTAVTIWFAIGGARDLRRMYALLRERHADARDDGTVAGESAAPAPARDERPSA